jgi:predicted TIM-barrel fold metal-dependent hydrolase
MIAVLLHKPNVWCELHGWSPKYFTDELKREIPRRLAERVMFAADYPLFRYERLFADWHGLGYSEQGFGADFSTQRGGAVGRVATLMDLDLAGKVAVVNGGSQGIG